MHHNNVYRYLVQLFAVVVAVLAVVGLLTVGRQLFGVMNVDIFLDILRVGLALYLIYAGFYAARNEHTIHNALWTVAVAFLGLSLLGMLDAQLWGLLPAGLSGFDIAFHLTGGLLGLIAAAAMKENRMPITT